MKKKILMIAALGAAAFGISTGANAAVRQGQFETSFSGSYSAMEMGGADMDTLAVDVKAGYFVTTPIQVSIGLSYLDSDMENVFAPGVDIELEALMVGAGVDYHFMTSSQFVPYVGGALHWVDVDMDTNVGGQGGDDDWAWEVHAGIKHFVARNVAIKYQVSYIEYDDLDLDGINLAVGLSFFF